MVSKVEERILRRVLSSAMRYTSGGHFAELTKNLNR